MIRHDKERTASERYFLSICATETSPVIKALAETCDVQANITRLMKIHGEIVAAGDATEEAQAARAAINKNLVEVRLRRGAAANRRGAPQAPSAKREPDNCLCVCVCVWVGGLDPSRLSLWRGGFPPDKEKYQNG